MTEIKVNEIYKPMNNDKPCWCRKQEYNYSEYYT